jgi:hypothetical protein
MIQVIKLDSKSIADNGWTNNPAPGCSLATIGRPASSPSMSQALGATPQANQRAIDALMEEIAFQKVLLDSIDDSVENREEAEDEVRAEIKTLEKQLRTLRRGPGTTKSASQSTTIPSQSAASTSLPSTSRNDAAMNNFFAAGSQNGYQGVWLKLLFWIVQTCWTIHFVGPKFGIRNVLLHFTSFIQTFWVIF